MYFVGSGDLEAKLIQKVIRLKLSDNVIFTGAISHSALNSYYQKADVFALPSLNEGMSNSLLEAMSSGLAIVATDTGGTKELVDRGNGIIVQKNNSASIFQALETLYLNKDVLGKYKQQSRVKAEKMSWQVAAEKYLEIYKK